MKASLTATMILAFGSSTALGATPRWVAAWQASPTKAIDFTVPYIKVPPPVHGTISYHMRLTAGGDAVRLRLSAEMRDDAFSASEASVAIAGPDGKPREESVRVVTFSGDRAPMVPAGAALVSDPVAMLVRAGDDIIVTLRLPRSVKLDQADERFTLDVVDETGAHQVTAARPLVSAIDVETGVAMPVVVTLGDSITDGTGGKDPMRGWPGALAARLAASGPISIVNAGIAGNRLLGPIMGPSALARFDRDVGAVSGVTHVILLEGINDIGGAGMSYPGHAPLPEAGADAIIRAYRQLIARAHLRGLRIIGATLTPFAGVPFDGYYSRDKEAIRTAVNEWIRHSGAFDGVIDFDAALRDPARHDHLNASFDSGDHLHPSDAGYRAMAAAVDPRLFR